MTRSSDLSAVRDPAVLATEREDRDVASLVDVFGVAVVRGTAGTGKSAVLTRLADATARTHRDVVVVRCDDHDVRPLAALADLAGQLLDRSVVTDLGHHVEALHVLAGRPVDDGIRRVVPTPSGACDRHGTVRWAVGQLLEALVAPRRPLLIGIDDIHLAPPLSRATVRELAERVGEADMRTPSCRTRVVVTERIEPGADPAIGFGRGRLPEMVLAPWDAARVAHHLRVHLGDDPWIDDSARWIARASSGLPEFVAELCERVVHTSHELVPAVAHRRFAAS